MPEVALYNQEGEKVREVALKDELFGVTPNRALVHQAVVAADTNRRTFSAKAKTRSEVIGSTAKIWRQKGTGRAWHGSRKAPLFVGGGRAHGPRPRTVEVRMPRKMRRAAMRSALSAKVADGQVTVLEQLELEEFSTKAVVRLLAALDVEGRALLVLGEPDEKVLASARNVNALTTRVAPHVTIREIVDCDHLILTEAAVAKLEAEWLP